MIEIKKISDDDVFEAVSLSEYAFNLAPMSAKKVVELQKREKKENTWGLYNENKLCAKVVILPLQMYIQSRLFDTGGVMGVATYPSSRRKGYSKKLIIESLKIMKEQGISISILHPFSHSFYRKYGWENYCEYKKYTISMHSFILNDNKDEGTVLLKKHDWTELNQIYEKYASNFNGMLKRTPEWWDLYKNHCAYQAVYYNEDSLGGYLLYNIKDRNMEIEEFVFLDVLAQKALMQYIQNHDSSVDSITMKVPVDDHMSNLLENPILDQRVVPYFMARIINVENFIKQYSFVSTGNKSRILMRIVDEYAKWNNDLFEINIEADGSAKMYRMPSYLVEDMKCSIGTLTTILMGFQSASELFKYGLLDGKKKYVELFDEVIPPTRPYTADLF
ncbi:GNAT family N-acetyltransferase [Paenibacillus sp. KN14-4R]|uniref:GNAT family N-acetyltransferase n=1 Tax=Paenibacillus sp. KN14-4R TaxID=3445773 RepID=UPI003FA043B7